MSNSPSIDKLKELYQVMRQAREADLIEQEYTGRGEAFFHVSGAGHEASAALNSFLGPQDWLHVHYRDKALMMARGIPPSQFFLALFNKDGSHSRGRQMNAHMSSPELKIMSLTGPVGNNALHAVGAANAIKDNLGKPIVVCSLGDGMTQQGEVLEGVAHAVRATLPVLFLIQDNQFAISTTTAGKTFYDRPEGQAKEFYGIPIRRVDGRDPIVAWNEFESTVADIRATRKPAILVFYVDRLDSHTNADDHRVYRPEEELTALRLKSDPILRLQKHMEGLGVPSDYFDKTTESLRTELRLEAKKAQRSTEPSATHTALKPLDARFFDPSQEYRGNPLPDAEKLNMLEAIRETLKKRMKKDERVTLFGEDLEDPKGDVFGITKGLSTAYPGRVNNSPLAEASIIGLSIGEAMAGRRPVAFLQFADFLPIAYNQIVSELASMFWRTDGGWQVPVIVMITCGGYRPGLGPFHASSYEALAVHTPGVDVMMPSTAGDAAGLLNTAFESGRPTLFFYPKNCLNDPAQATSMDVEKHFIPLGIARKVRAGRDITMVAWGNTVSLCRKAADLLATAGVEAEILDLRTLLPWDRKQVLNSVEKTRRMVVVHEDNKSSGLGAEVMAEILEYSSFPIQAKRVVRDDTFVPCNYANQLEVLPGYKRIVDTCVEMLSGTITWRLDAAPVAGTFLVPAIGSSPSDESITVVKWNISKGASIEEGQLIAELEADKAALDLRSPVGGLVEEILVPEGDTVGVGASLLMVRLAGDDVVIKPITREEPGTPIITGINLKPTNQKSELAGTTPGLPRLAQVAVKKGSRIMTNEAISQLCPAWGADEILKRVGIETRPWVAEGENALTLSVAAVKDLLNKTHILPQHLDMIICATGTPLHTSPSLAAMVQNQLSLEYGALEMTCFDFSAACSGYIYGLQIAHDFLAQKPDGKILLITTEVLSPRIDVNDTGTAPIFSDASTASLLVGPQVTEFEGGFTFRRPVMGAKGEDGNYLKVPVSTQEFIVMDGPKVYLEAVEAMTKMTKDALVEAHLNTDDLDLVIPHQANQRIINAVRQKLKLPDEKIFSNIRHNGNSSSCTIPIGILDVWKDIKPRSRVALVAFGGGFTYGAVIMDHV